MPELPEVESIVRSLDKKISGKKIYRICFKKKHLTTFAKKIFYHFTSTKNPKSLSLWKIYYF